MSDEFDPQIENPVELPEEEHDSATLAKHKQGTNDYFRRMIDRNFLDYASYVIGSRAIPDVDDGLKPVQRRILWALYQVYDGRTQKVANIVGNTMHYHPHGDASIGDALVVLANKGGVIENRYRDRKTGQEKTEYLNIPYFIMKQGNFGNILTGSPAAAGRYTECGLTKLAYETMFNNDITPFVPNYDGREEEPVVLPAKLPSLLMLGSDGIAVGMSTCVLPHNFNELIDAEIAVLQGRAFELYPDFQQGALMDPTDLRPIGACRVVLIEYVIHTLVVEGRMRLIHPYCRRNCVILRTVTVALVNRIVKCDVLPIEIGVIPGGIGVVVDLTDLLGCQGRGVNLNLVKKAGDHLSLDTELDLRAYVCADTKRLLGRDDACCNKLGNDRLVGLFAIVEEGDIACVTVEGNGNVGPLVKRKCVDGIVEAYYEVLACFLAVKCQLNAPKAQSAVAEQEALAHLDITLIDDRGKAGMSRCGGCTVVINDILKNSGSYPCGHGNCRGGSYKVSINNIV